MLDFTIKVAQIMTPLSYRQHIKWFDVSCVRVHQCVWERVWVCVCRWMWMTRRNIMCSYSYSWILGAFPVPYRDHYICVTLKCHSYFVFMLQRIMHIPKAPNTSKAHTKHIQAHFSTCNVLGEYIFIVWNNGVLLSEHSQNWS